MKITQIIAIAGSLMLTSTVSIADGKTGYEGKCAACHGFGVAGAPKLGDAAAWKDRIAQGNDTLYDNAINGFTGATGVMPPKGGFTALSDDEIKAIVDYMVSQSQ
ncbi:MAG: c-type cytochrome [Gammaproteobacteria bacterium]|nr:c-type cytochrome [Gammaproteobacteria bacterium]